MAPHYPPGLSAGEPIESATASREKRRVALAARAVISEFTSVFFHRLDGIAAKVDALCAKVDRTVGDGLRGEDARAGVSHDISGFDARLSRLELLLFRVPLEEFKIVDEHVKATLPKLMEAKNINEPEIEMSPGKKPGRAHVGAAMSPQEHVKKYLDTAVHFDISSEDGGSSEYASTDVGSHVSLGIDVVGDWRIVPEATWTSIYTHFPHPGKDAVGVNSNCSAHAQALPKFEKDDWVISNRRLVSIMRFGYGAYDGQVRVAHPDESLDAWSSGTWRSIAVISPLEFPRRFRATSSFQSADKIPVDISPGMEGTLWSFDRDGDLVVSFNDDAEKKYVFMSDATKLEFELEQA